LKTRYSTRITVRTSPALTTRQIARAYLVPERTMAQRISRAKHTVSRAGVERPAHGSEGQRDRRRRRQVGVCAQEVEAQRVVGARDRAGRRLGVESELSVAARGV
jgi:predicted RNA polymerase sigma factor